MFQHFTLAVLTPKAPLTDFHQEQLRAEVKSLMEGTESLTVMVPQYGDELVPPFLRSLARTPKYAGRISLAIYPIPLPYKTEVVGEWALKADRIVACPSRVTCGRIVDRVYGVRSWLLARIPNVPVFLPKDHIDAIS